jgi:hypothetical protein
VSSNIRVTFLFDMHCRLWRSCDVYWSCATSNRRLHYHRWPPVVRESYGGCSWRGMYSGRQHPARMDNGLEKRVSGEGWLYPIRTFPTLSRRPLPKISVGAFLHRTKRSARFSKLLPLKSSRRLPYLPPEDPWLKLDYSLN